MAAVPTGRVEPKPSRPEHTDDDKGEDLEADERRLLRELIDRDIPGGEDGDALGAVERVVPEGVGSEHLDVELAAADDHNVVVGQVVASAKVPLLHCINPG